MLLMVAMDTTRVLHPSICRPASSSCGEPLPPGHQLPVHSGLVHQLTRGALAAQPTSRRPPAARAPSSPSHQLQRPPSSPRHPAGTELDPSLQCGPRTPEQPDNCSPVQLEKPTTGDPKTGELGHQLTISPDPGPPLPTGSPVLVGFPKTTRLASFRHDQPGHRSPCSPWSWWI